MSIIKITGLSFWLLGCYVFLLAQPAYHVQRFTTDNGLPSNGIKGLQWDEHTGFLWIATEAGVARYNGFEFVLFNKANSPSMYSERMLFLLKNRDGRIFTSDETGDVFFVEKNKLQFMGQTRIDTRPATFKLIGLTASGRLFRQSSLEPPDNIGFYWQREQVIPISEDRLLLTTHDSLYDYRVGKRSPSFLFALGPNTRVFYLGHSLFTFNPRQGFFRLDPDTLKSIPVPVTGCKADEQMARPTDRANAAAPSLFWDNGMKRPILVIGSDAWILDYTGGKLTAQLVCTALPTDGIISDVKYDSSSGMVFAGTQSKGIIVIRGNQVRSVKNNTFPPEQQTAYYSQVALPDGRILTSNGHILPEGPKTLPATHAPLHTPFNNFVLLEPDSTLWYSQEDTIFTWSFRTHTGSRIQPGSGSITDGFVRSGGQLYIANAIGIGVLHERTVDYSYRYPQANINSNVPFSMLDIGDSQLAIGTCEGLFRFNTGSHRLDTLLRIPGTCMRALWKYGDYLFVGTYGRGIYVYKDGKIRPIPLDKRGYLQYAHCFIPDNIGYCWISTNRGLFRVRPAEMTAAFEQKDHPITYRYYGREDGMDMTELNGGCTPCALKLDDSVISFPSMDGLVWVNPRLPILTLPDDSVYIDEFVADSQQVNLTGLMKPVLPADTRDLSFDLAFPSWSSKENLDIEYQLEPWSNDWRALPPSHSPELHFNNLPYGSYRLLIRKPNGDKDLVYPLTSFYIEPHWYQQPWSWLAGGCLLCIMVMTIVWWRTRQFHIRQDKLETQIAEKTRQLQRKNEELEKTDGIKTRLISIISHDLVTPLRFLHLTGKSLIEKKTGLTEELQQEVLSEMATTARELELLSTNILNWIKYQNEDRRLAKESFDLHELVAQIFAIFGAAARQKELSLINDVREGLILYQYIEPVKIVLYNLILNGINFTSTGFIRISSENIREGIALRIQDTGVGMTMEQINNIMADHFIISSANVDNRKGNGLGYLIIKDLLRILRGHLSIQSEKEKGTTVTVSIVL